MIEALTMSACLDVGPTKLSYAGLTYRKYLLRWMKTFVYSMGGKELTALEFH